MTMTETVSPPAPERFEEALKKLEEIVQRLERGELTLEDSLSCYEEGIRLSRFCHGKLEEAERKIETLVKDARGEVAVDETGAPKRVPFRQS
jgi:exodeoxyribonuclease VII small subunit